MKNLSVETIIESESTVFSEENTLVQQVSTGFGNPSDWQVGDIVFDNLEVLPVDEDGSAYHSTGGMGMVFKMYHKNWNTVLAVKIPRIDKFENEKLKQMFINECQAWIHMGMHQNIATCYFVKEFKDYFAIFAEYIDGGSLSDLIESGLLYEQGNLEIVLDIFIQFAWGLYYAHQNSLIHMDVKPANVLITKDKIAKVMDFGISSFANNKSCGGYTPRYASPEQCKAQKISYKTDIWSYGVSLMEVVFGIQWMSGSIAGAVLQELKKDYEKNSQLYFMPPELIDIMEKCLQEDALNRYDSMKTVSDELIMLYEKYIGKIYPYVYPKGGLIAECKNNYALSYIELDQQDLALSSFQDAINFQPSNPTIIYNFGLLKWKKGLYSDDDIIQNLKNHSMKNPLDFRYTYFMAKIYMIASDYNRSLELLNKAKELCCESKEVDEAILKLENNKTKLGGKIASLSFDGEKIKKIRLKKNEYWVCENNNCVICSDKKCLVRIQNKQLELLDILNQKPVWSKTVGSYKLIGTIEGNSELEQDIILVKAISNIIVYSLSSGQKIGYIRNDANKLGMIKNVAYNKNIPYIFSLSAVGLNNQVFVYNICNGKLLKHITDVISTESMTVSYDGEYCFFGSEKGLITIMDIPDFDVLQRISFEGNIKKIWVTPDNRDIVFVTEYSKKHTKLKVIRYSLEQERILYTVELENKHIDLVDMTDDRKYLFIYKDNNIAVYDLFGESVESTYQLLSPNVIKKNIIQDQSLAKDLLEFKKAMGKKDYDLALNKAKNLRKKQSNLDHAEVYKAYENLYPYFKKNKVLNMRITDVIIEDENIVQYDISKDGRYIVIVTESSMITVYDLLENQITCKHDIGIKIDRIHLAEDNSYLFVCTNNYKIIMFDFKTMKKEFIFLAHQEYSSLLNFICDMTYDAKTGVLVTINHGRIKTFDVKNKKTLLKTFETKTYSDSIKSITDNHFVIKGKNTCEIFNLNENTCEPIFIESKELKSKFWQSDDGLILLFIVDDYYMGVNLVTKQLVFRFKKQIKDINVDQLILSQDLCFLFVIYEDGILDILDIKQQKSIWHKKIDGHCVKLTLDQRNLLINNKREIKVMNILWDLD